MDGQKEAWRNLGEFLLRRKGKKESLGEEFPSEYFLQEGEGISRREFLKLGGASLAGAGLALAGCRKAESYLVPYTASPEWVVPGNPLRYATSMPHRSGAIPLWVITYEGRPTHLEPNQLWSGKAKGLSAQIQASIYDLYDPDRSRVFLRDGRPISRKDFIAWIRELARKLQAAKGKGVALLLEPSPSPTLARLCQELVGRYPELLLATYQPISNEIRYRATECFYGARYALRPRWDWADVVVSIDCDFLNGSEEGPGAVTAFMANRRVRMGSDRMNRLYCVESRYTVTGATADHRLPLRVAEHPYFLAALVRELVARGKRELEPLANVLPGGKGIEAVPVRWIAAVAEDLLSAAHPLVWVGRSSPWTCQLLALAVNEAFQPASSLQLLPPVEPKFAGLQELAGAIEEGKIETLGIVGANPVYTAPAALEWKKLQTKVPETFHAGLYYDETAAVSRWHAPLAHYLEDWGDGFAADGTYVTQQPAILPLYRGVSVIEILAALLGDPQALEELPPSNPTFESLPTLPGQPSPVPLPAGLRLVEQTFAQKTGLQGWELAKAWRKCLHDGFWPQSTPDPVTVPGNWPKLVDALPKELAPRIPEGAWELVLYPCPKIDDGRYANNAWLQELPDSVTKITWDNAVLLSPATAEKLGIRQEEVDLREVDLWELEVEGKTLEAAVFIVPGHPDGSLSLALGYGRQSGGRIASQCGFNGYRLSGSDLLGPKIARLKATGRRYPISQTQHHWRMEGRALVREGTLSLFQKKPSFAREGGEETPEVSLYPHPFAPPEPEGPPYRARMTQGPHQWAMVVDLGSCVGCNACIVACQSENNVPVVGKDQVARYRAMHWIRVDRYFLGDPREPRMLFEPVLCQQCEEAPCEPVCPVNATVHSEDGLNVMVYNRCIGTRACANNCPYKVRRFNYFDYNKRDVIQKWHVGPFTLSNLYLGPFGALGTREPLPLQKNPRVTVRMRGVMEKCTFCIQRIEAAKIQALAQARDSAQVQVPTDSFQTACQAACPAEAIVFGNLADPKSRVNQWWSHPRSYTLLRELNTRPRVRYLARIRNPNPAMEKEEGMETESKG